MVQAKNRYKSFKFKTVPDLPILSKKDEIIEKINQHSVVIISGETGSGKTTQIPKFLLAAGYGRRKMIGCTQPRRIAAINVAQRIAHELGQSIGETIGYKIRFDDRSYRECMVKIMTDGILLAEAQKDGFLNQYEVIIVDEAHERSLNIDFTLGILRKLTKKRKDLKLIITSATLDTEKFSKAFNNAPVIEVSGRLFPVEVKYMQAGNPDDRENTETAAQYEVENEEYDYVEGAAKAVDYIISRYPDGDILVFMPTEQDISETIELVAAHQRDHKTLITLPLFARLASKDQQKIFSGSPFRKVIVSTNVAETSLTIPSIRYVIDTGLARIPSYSPRTRTTSMPVKKISRSSADQRMGRCGRVANGVCIRLFSEEDFNLRPFFTPPEIVRSNLAEVILRMISLRLGDVKKFPFIDSPSEKSIKDGFNTLKELGAIKEKTILKDRKKQKTDTLSKIGKTMASIPVDPKLSRILIEAAMRGCIEEALIITSALSTSDPRQRPRDKAQHADQKHGQWKDPDSDFISYLNIWKAYKDAARRLKSRSKLRKFCHDNFLSFRRLKEWEDISRQIKKILSEKKIKINRIHFKKGTKGLKSKENSHGSDMYRAIHKSLLAGYLTNIAHKKENHIFNAAKGQQVTIFPGSNLFKSAGQWIMAARFVKTSRLFARINANIDPAWVEEVGKNFCTYTWSSPHYEKKRGEVIAMEQVSLSGLVLVAERPVSYGRINPEEAGDIFIRKALVEGELDRGFKFMVHNEQLIEELEALEDKTRKRGIVATDDDIFLFYKNRLKKNFYDVRTFSKFLKDNDDSFLRMARDDLIRAHVDEDELASFPDTLEMGSAKFKLEYMFSPGAKEDGVTVKIPAASAASVSSHAMDRLVPGLLNSRITGLIKNLPKKYRINLLPVSGKAAMIAEKIPKGDDRPLFTLLSRIIKERFNVDIPASAWSDENLEPHLKMRISIRDEKDREIAASRDKALINRYHDTDFEHQDALGKERAEYERGSVVSWDFKDVGIPIKIEQSNGIFYNVFKGLAMEGGKVALRLYRSEKLFNKGHKEGVMGLYQTAYTEQFKTLQRDLRSSFIIKKHAGFFGGAKKIQSELFDAITRHLFLKDIREEKEFNQYALQIFPKLYNKTIEFCNVVDLIMDGYQATDTFLKKLSLRAGTRAKAGKLIEHLYCDLKNLVPENFLKLYEHDRLGHIPRYLKAIRIRAGRGFDDPLKDSKKAFTVEKYSKQLNALLENLSQKTSFEKSEKIEQFFWMLEEYKISVFAQEVKPVIKVSAKILDGFLLEISTMV